MLSQAWDTPHSGLISQQLLILHTWEHSQTCLLPQVPACPSQQSVKRTDITVSPVFEHGRSTMDQKTCPVARNSTEVSLLSGKGHCYVLSSFLLSPIPLKMAQWCSPLRISQIKNKQVQASHSVVEEGSRPTGGPEGKKAADDPGKGKHAWGRWNT